MHPDDNAVVQRRILERRSGERGARNVEVRFLNRKASGRPSGALHSEDNWITFQISTEGVYADDPSVPDAFIGSQGVARDISRTRHFEEQVDQLAAVVEQAAEDVIITNTEGVVRYVNPQFEKVTGYSSVEVVGKTPGLLKSGKHPPR